MTLRVGFLGGGFIAHYHGKMLHRSGADVEIAMVHDPDTTKGAAFAAASGAAIAASEDELLSSVDAVYVCTWTAEHPRLVIEAARRGLPVFCEKPLAVDLAGATAMRDAVADAGVVNQVGLVLRDSPAFLTLRRLVNAPESGRVMSVVFRDDQYLPIQGQYGSSWRADRTKAGAGTLLEHSIHDVDMLEWLFGPIAAGSATSASFHEIDGIEDAVVASLRFASGALGSLVSVWHDLLERPSLRRVEVLCERAHFWLDDDVAGPVHYTRPGGDEGSTSSPGVELRNPDGAFVEAARTGTPATPDLAVAWRAHVVTDALYRSAAAGGSWCEVAAS
jgi:myo-inositol 2-dehydrogenase/D-chiro-inositol 1-dehydrogenase